MANLNNEVFEFRRHFDIADDFKDDQVFKLDPRGNSITVWNNKYYHLTNKRNPTKFLSVSTRQNKLKYGVDFLRDLKLIAPKVSRKKEKPEPAVIPLEDQLNSFKEFHNIPDGFQIDADFRVVDGKLSTLLNDKYVPLVQQSKPLANSTLQGKYGAALLC